MKKSKLTIILYIISVLLLSLTFYHFATQPTGLLKKYAKTINYYKKKWPRDMKIEYVGIANSVEEAIEQAEIALLNYNYISEFDLVQIRPLKVEYDEKNKIWHVYNRSEDFSYSGEIHILFRQKDGKVLAIWVGVG